MNTKIIKKNNYNLYMTNTEKFKSTVIKASFKNITNEKTATYIMFLAKILLESSKNYPNKRELILRARELYGSSFSITNPTIGNVINFNFQIEFLNKEYLKENIFGEIINFLKEIIFNPNVKNNAFDIKSFEKVKRKMIENYKSQTENKDIYSNIKFLKAVEENNPMSINPYGNIKILEKITPQNLYEFYNNIIKSNPLDIFVVGKIDFIKIESVISNLFKEKKSDEKIELYAPVSKLKKKPLEIIEEINFEQSVLNIGLKIENITEFEKEYVIRCYNYIIGYSSNSKLFKNIREKYSLCYFISSYYRKFNNLFVINAGIDKNNYENVLNLIKIELENMKNGNFDMDDIKDSKTNIINFYDSITESHAGLISINSLERYKKIDSIEKKKENIEKITKEDIINLAKKINIDTIYLLKGVKNERN